MSATPRFRPLLRAILSALWLFSLASTIPAADTTDSEPEDPVARYLAVPLASFNIQKKTLQEAITILIEQANAAGAETLGFKGVVVSSQHPPDEKISVQLTHIPVGKVLEYLASVGGPLALVERDGACILSTPKVGEPELATFQLSSEERAKLGIGGETQMKEIRAELKKRGVSFGTAGTINFLPKYNTFVVKLRHEEMQILRSLVTLIRRGVTVSPRSEHGEQANSDAQKD